MKPQESYHINGYTYVLKEETAEPVKREPIKAWANVYPQGSFRGYAYFSKEVADKAQYIDRLECVELNEVPKGSLIISKDDITNALDKTDWNLEKFSSYKSFLKALGF